MAKVSIICKSVEHYRIDFFDQLYKALQKNNICLQIIAGEYHDKEKNPPWLVIVPNKSICFLGREMIWQPCLSFIKDSDLVIVEQANKLLLNYYLLLSRIISKKMIAFWGHGRNFQSKDKNSFEEKIKSYIAKRPDWWFAYTQRSVDLLNNIGYTKGKITRVNNAIDTTDMIDKYSEITDSETNQLAKELNIGGANTGIYIGALYKAKKIDFLIESCLLVKQQVSDFELIIVGSGEDQDYVNNMAEKYHWIHYAGPIYGDEKLKYLKLAKVFLLPGVIGLAILDAFATETPPVLIAQEGHGPEISYLHPGENGLLIDTADQNHYANQLTQLLSDEDKYVSLVEGCRKSAREYSLEKMVANFCNGILQALSISEEQT